MEIENNELCDKEYDII